MKISKSDAIMAKAEVLSSILCTIENEAQSNDNFIDEYQPKLNDEIADGYEGYYTRLVAKAMYKKELYQKLIALIEKA